MNNPLLEAYLTIKAYMEMLDIDIQTAWLYLEEGYNKVMKENNNE